MREVTEAELDSIRQAGGKVRRPRPKPEKKATAAPPVPKPVPPPVPSQDVPLPQQPAATLPADAQVAKLVEAQAQLMAHNSAVIQSFGEQLKTVAASRTPVPWKLIVNRSEKGFISDIDLVPVV